jgi:MFS family permease
VASAGALLCSGGLLVASLSRPDLVWPTLLGFGVLAGTGIGLGYAAATPAAVKWFGAAKKGAVTGIVVAGFGLAPVYIAPAAKYFLETRGVAGAFRVFGLLFLVVAGVSSQFLVNPKAAPAVPAADSAKATPAKASSSVDRTWREMLRSPAFWSLYLQFACGATAGLMIIGHMAKIASVQSGGAIKAGFLFVAVLAIFNAGGRVVAGLVSDIIGRVGAMVGVFVLQATNMFFFDQYASTGGFLFGAALVGFNYGACLSLFPATAADLWGTKNLGLNYGILFTAWGVGGVFGPSLAGMIADANGSYAMAYRVAAGLLIFAALLGTLSHIQLSFRLAEQGLVITLGKRKKGEGAPALAEAEPLRKAS